MSIIFTKWNSLIIGKLNPSNADKALFTNDYIKSLILQSEAEQENVRTLLIESLIDKPNIRDKQQYVQLNQALLIRLLDTLHSYKQHQGLKNEMIRLYDVLSQHLQQTLDFIEDFFANYFDRKEKVPASYLSLSKEEIKRQLKRVNSFFVKHHEVDKRVATVIRQCIQQFVNAESRVITYTELSYQKDLLSELLAANVLKSTQSIRETLYFLNFNENNFIGYEYERLKQLTENLPSKKEKVSVLRFEQKGINQLSAKLNCYYSVNMPSLKEQINGWIDEEVKFLENEHLPEKIENSILENGNKIHTSLSVAKLALLIRLLVIDKIIINRTVAPMLRIAAKIFTTLQKEDISFGSLETKYHAPDKATINAVKDMLFKWINLLNKL